MNKKIIIAFLSFGLILFLAYKSNFSFSFTPSTAYAVGDLTVNWGVPSGNPIFTINNFFPGQTEIHTVIVKNNASVNRPVGVRGIKTLETGNLSSKLFLKISENGIDLYGGTKGLKTLADFLSASSSVDGITLSTLSPNQQTTYIFTVLFDPTASNAFQNKKVIFDLKIGIAVKIPAKCSYIDLKKKTPIFGTYKNDHIIGTKDDDIIFGFEGDDWIEGKGGKDCIVGGKDDDDNDIYGHEKHNKNDSEKEHKKDNDRDKKRK